MKPIGIGIDLVEISRIEASIERFGQKFLDRIFTNREQEYCLKKRNKMGSLAGRFAAKEAVSKALGSGIGGKISWLDIEVVQSKNGVPAIKLHSKTSTAHSIYLSLSHTQSYATASVWITSL